MSHRMQHPELGLITEQKSLKYINPQWPVDVKWEVACTARRKQLGGQDLTCKCSERGLCLRYREVRCESGRLLYAAVFGTSYH